MNELDKLLASNADELLGSVDKYQMDILRDFLQTSSNDFLGSADKWLSASTANTAKFGGDSTKTKIYREKLFDELEKFLCGDQQYDDDRKKIADSTDKSQKYIIGVMSAAIGKTLGAAGAFIAPVIVLLILSIGKMAINAWCAMRTEQRAAESKNPTTG
jgi:hypothetical protein